MREALDQPTARGTVEMLLKRSIAKPTRSRPRGCLLVQGALACSDASRAVRRELSTLRLANEMLLRRRFEQAIAQKDLPADSDAAALATFISTFLQGLAVQAAGGASCKALSAAVEVALRAWPTPV